MPLNLKEPYLNHIVHSNTVENHIVENIPLTLTNLFESQPLDICAFEVSTSYTSSEANEVAPTSNWTSLGKTGNKI